MRKLFFAGLLVLATIALLPEVSLIAHAADLSIQGGATSQEAAIDIGRVKSVLKLTPEQEPYWQPVEAALRGIARQQAHSESDGFVRRVSRRMVSIVLNSAAVERLAVAARPLIARLNDQQKQAAGQLAQEMGLGAVVMAALN